MSNHERSPGLHARQPSGPETNVPVGVALRYPGQSPVLPHHQAFHRERSLELQPPLGPVLPPPRPSSQASIESDRRASRPALASVHSILNPTNDHDVEPRGRRRSAAQMEEESTNLSPRMAETTLSRPSSSGGPQGETSPPGFQGSSKRRITTFSPSMHRVNSSSRIITGSIDAQSTGTIDARGTPFLSSASSMHTVELGTTGAPQLPSISAQMGPRQSFSYSQAPTPPVQHATIRRRSVSVIPSAQSVSSARASPSPSYTSYSRSGQASPAHTMMSSSGPTPPGSYSLAPSPISGPLSLVPSVSLDSEGSHGIQGIPVVSAGQSTYELFSINTTRGTVALPVEVHVASRQADEKRKRNAGASARFRQRRKEKEREANTTIDKLRDDLRAQTQDARYYKAERDRYLEILKTMPGWERHLPRSPSPSVMRAQQEPRSCSTEDVTNPSSPQSGSNSEHLPIGENDRSMRRRTDAYALPIPSPTATTPGYQSPFPPYSPNTAGPPAQHHPPYSPTSLDATNGHSRHSMNDIPHGARPGYGSAWPSHPASVGRP